MGFQYVHVGRQLFGLFYVGYMRGLGERYFKEENSSEVYLCFLIVGLLNGYLRDLCMVLW